MLTASLSCIVSQGDVSSETLILPVFAALNASTTSVMRPTVFALYSGNRKRIATSPPPLLDDPPHATALVAIASVASAVTIRRRVARRGCLDFPERSTWSSPPSASLPDLPVGRPGSVETALGLPSSGHGRGASRRSVHGEGGDPPAGVRPGPPAGRQANVLIACRTFL